MGIPVLQPHPCINRCAGDKPARADMVLAPDTDGRQRNVRKLDEKLVLRKDVAPGPQVGKVMRLLAGRHEGLECSVLALLEREEGRSGVYQ